MLVILVFLFVGCEEAQLIPQSRELVVVNGTTDAQIFRIDVEAFPFGQRKVDLSGYFQFREDDLLESEEQFSIVVSPYVYRVVVSVSFIQDENDFDIEYRMVTIDLPENQSMPTYITLIYDDSGDYPGYTLEVIGEYTHAYSPIFV